MSRELIARIIDPLAFKAWEHAKFGEMTPAEARNVAWSLEVSRTKADQIIAALSGGGGEAVAWRVRANRNHPLVEHDPFERRLSETRPLLGEGAKPEWFDVDALGATDGPVVETYAERMAKPRRMLLLCSYCSGETVQCSDDHPCADCLVNCNTFMISREAVDAAEYAGTLPGIVQGSAPLKKRLPRGRNKATPPVPPISPGMGRDSAECTMKGEGQ